MTKLTVGAEGVGVGVAVGVGVGVAVGVGVGVAVGLGVGDCSDFSYSPFILILPIGR